MGPMSSDGSSGDLQHGFTATVSPTVSAGEYHEMRRAGIGVQGISDGEG